MEVGRGVGCGGGVHQAGSECGAPGTSGAGDLDAGLSLQGSRRPGAGERSRGRREEGCQPSSTDQQQEDTEWEEGSRGRKRSRSK